LTGKHILKENFKAKKMRKTEIKKKSASSAVFSAQHKVNRRAAVSHYDVTTGNAGTLTRWQEVVGSRISLTGVDAPLHLVMMIARTQISQLNNVLDSVVLITAG